MDSLQFQVQFGSQLFEITLPESATLQRLAEVMHELLPHLDVSTMKFITGGRAVRPTTQVTLRDFCIRSGSRVKLMASSAAGVQAVHRAQEPPRVPGFEHEERREVLRQTPPAAVAGRSAAAQFFGRLEPWQHPGLQPPPSEATKLLEKLASDPGILYLMRKYKWRVGCLSEMPPEGKVGISPVCILGVNINRGAEISLRLRTDDLKGFRKYRNIIETFCHELAHMQFDAHDNAFKRFNSELRSEAEAADWTVSGARTPTGQTASAAPTLAGLSAAEAAAAQPRSAMAASASSSGRTLRDLAGGTTPPAGPSPKAAAAAAAMRRFQGGTAEKPQLASHPVELTPPPSPPRQTAPPRSPHKGDKVLYRQRDGTWVPAKVVAVDMSVRPYSYGIELPGEDGASPHYRETEADRLQPAPQVADGTKGDSNDGDIQGMGHFDPTTAEKELQVQALER